MWDKQSLQSWVDTIASDVSERSYQNCFLKLLMSNKSLLFQGSPYDITSPTDSVIGADFQVFVQVLNRRSLRSILKSSRCRVWARRSKSGRGRSGKQSWGKPRRRFWLWGRCSLPRSATQQAKFNWKFLRNSTENLGLKRRLGITQWREFSEDMTQVVNILTLCFFTVVF